jgi:hypothetical protein
MTIADVLAADPFGYSPSGINQAPAEPKVTHREYVRAAFSGAIVNVRVRKSPPGLPMWKLILLREGYEEQASESEAIAELAIPAAIQAIDNPY